MIRVESPKDQVTVAKVYEAGQEQVFEYWEELGATERKQLLAQLELVDFQELNRLVRTLILEEEDHGLESLEELRPAELIPLDSKENGNRPELDAAVAAGEDALRQGQVAVFLVAGGQGTRLRFEGPKGLFPLGPVSAKSLFQIHAEKILAVERRYKNSIPWIIMTSDANHDDTVAFFQQHSYFGLNPADVSFQRQGMLPVVDPRRGKMLLRSKGEIILGPNGHGGAVSVIQSLAEHLTNRGIEYLFYLQVDNPMITMCDPAFIGYHIVRGSHFSSKAIPKLAPDEKVGVFCQSGDRLVVVEYSELGDREREARETDGRLSFRGGNLANHVVSVDFLCGKTPLEMPYHCAHKAVPYLRDGETVTPEKPNSIKFESFLFDVLPRARNPIVVETGRREFAPLKNFEGDSSPEATQHAMMEEWSQWLAGVGIEIPRDAEGTFRHPFEISALFADGPEALKDRWNGRELDFTESTYIE